MPVKVLNL